MRPLHPCKVRSDRRRLAPRSDASDAGYKARSNRCCRPFPAWRPAVEQSDRGRLVDRQAVPRRQFHEEDVVVGVLRRDQTDQRGVADRPRQAPEFDRVARVGRPGTSRSSIARNWGPFAARNSAERLGFGPGPVRWGQADRPGRPQGGAAGDLVGGRAVDQGLEPPVAPGAGPEDRRWVERRPGPRAEATGSEAGTKSSDAGDGLDPAGPSGRPRTPCWRWPWLASRR